MIEFPCLCGEKLSADDAQAGQSIQCPHCRRLIDVPSPVDRFDAAGAYVVDIPLRDEDETSHVIEENRRVFGVERIDEEGHDIDLRPTYDDILRAGVTNKSALRPPERVRPKYDPETGELVRDIDIAPGLAEVQQTVQPVIPVAAVAVTYANNETMRVVRASDVPAELFRSVNLTVMFFVWIMHPFWQMFVFMLLYVPGMMAGIPVKPMSLAVLPILLMHMGNVIEETGPEMSDELPRLFRNLNWSTDLWGPFIQIASALMICYMPAQVVAWSLPAQSTVGPLVVNGLLVLGTCLAPVLMLTTATSGSLVNLRPDRVLSVIGRIGAPYIGLILLWAVSSVLYILAMLGTSLFSESSVLAHPFLRQLNSLYFSTSLLMLSIYLLHAYCWFLGLAYRAGHENFPWAMQIFLREREERRARQAADAAQRAKERAEAAAGTAFDGPAQATGRPSRAAAARAARQRQVR